MKEQNIITKRTAFVLKLISCYVVSALRYVIKALTTKRTVMLVTKNKIRSITLGPVMQVSLLILAIWVGNLFIQSIRYNTILNLKSEEISRLKSLNNYFEEEFNSVHEKLTKVNEYLSSLMGHDKKDASYEKEQNKFQTPNSIEGKDIEIEDKRTLKQIENIDKQIKNISLIAKARIEKIEKTISITGLDLNIAPEEIDYEAVVEAMEKNSTEARGGPIADDPKAEAELKKLSKIFNPEETIEYYLGKKQFVNEIEYLNTLEKLARVAPLSRPMKNFYISSGFGKRYDPFTRTVTPHRGLDFVGPDRETILSPSEGKVILARQFYGYGNAIVIDHGFGITTRYGHLSSIKVEEGQLVKKGDIIATQGNTGRSTGSHLHYEVRYKNNPLNPRKFIKAGDYMFNSKNQEYVRS